MHVSKRNLLEPKDGLAAKDLWKLPVNQNARDKVLEALRLEPFLTIPQVAGLFYSVRRDGQPASVTKIRPRQSKEYELVPGYHSARALLNRMVRDKVILKHATVEKSRPNLYSLPGQRRAYDDRHLYGHEMDCANVFVAYESTGLLDRWERRWDEEQRKQIGERFKLWPDRIFQLEGSDQVFFLEVDRGTEELDKQIRPKLENYVKLSLALGREQPFTVLFTAQGYRYHDSDGARLEELRPYLGSVKRGNQFLVALHSDVLKDPLGAIWRTPKDDSRLALMSL